VTIGFPRPVQNSPRHRPYFALRVCPKHFGADLAVAADPDVVRQCNRAARYDRGSEWKIFSFESISEQYANDLTSKNGKRGGRPKDRAAAYRRARTFP
jgi:hypothetical protein